MGAFNEFVTRADALADETFTEYTVTKRRFEAAERKRAETPVKHGLVSAEYAVRAAKAEADYLEAREKYETVKRGLPEKSSQMAAIRADFVAAVASHFAADPAKLDKATLALLESGILKPGEYERLMASAEKDENFTMIRLIAAKAAEVADKAPTREGEAILKAVAMRGRNADGADYIKAFDAGVVSLFERCLKNPSLYSSWDMLMQPVRDAL